MSFIVIPQKQKGKIHSQTKSVLNTVIERCIKEKTSNRLHVPLERYEERVSFYTGFPQSYISKLISNEERNSKLRNSKAVDPLNRFMIASCLKDFYFKQSFPSYKDVYLAVKQKNIKYDQNFIDFQNEIIRLGYTFRKTLNGNVLMEDPELTFERFHYLKKIKKHREQKSEIYYIDERCIIGNQSFNKTWLEDSNESYNDLVLFHVITREGYVNGLFCMEATEQSFMKWFIDIVLPQLKPSSVIVLDNSPIHGTPTSPSSQITRYHTKVEMLRWLIINNIPCSDKMHKAELFKLIENCSIRSEQYTLDSILKAHGHEVLRLPTNYYDLSATTFLWNDIRQKAKSPQNMHSPPRSIVETFIEELPLNKWVQYDHSVVNEENQIATLDGQIEEALDRYTFDYKQIMSENNSLFHMYDSFDDSD